MYYHPNPSYVATTPPRPGRGRASQISELQSGRARPPTRPAGQPGGARPRDAYHEQAMHLTLTVRALAISPAAPLPQVRVAIAERVRDPSVPDPG